MCTFSRAINGVQVEERDEEKVEIITNPSLDQIKQAEEFLEALDFEESEN